MLPAWLLFLFYGTIGYWVIFVYNQGRITKGGNAMVSFVEELYYGNINPQERTTDNNEILQEQMDIVPDSESYLM